MYVKLCADSNLCASDIWYRFGEVWDWGFFTGVAENPSHLECDGMSLGR